MDREIKFRVFDEDSRFMTYFLLWDIFDGGLVFEKLQENKQIDVVDLQSDYVHIMQSTNLKDRHGREIYEGDILAAEDGETLTVFWHEVMAGFGFTFTDGGKFQLGELDLRYWSIIGNIYEEEE